MEAKHKLIAVIGQTASGKTDLGIQIAREFNGEIICADSRTIYKYLDIGTAKPTPEERQQAVHHMIDVVEPDQKYTVSDFKTQAINIINDIYKRNKLPILVGGSGLYIDSVIFDYKFRPSASTVQRNKLEQMDLGELAQLANSLGISPEEVNFKNKRHLTRAIEAGGVRKDDVRLRPNTLVLGVSRDPETLSKRITDRVHKMFEAGFVDEVKQVADKYGWDNPAMTSIGYRALRGYLDGAGSLEEAKELFVRGDILLAKKQRTWFKRNKYVHWVNNTEEAMRLVADFLNKTD